jgi:hypothetical protein
MIDEAIESGDIAAAERWVWDPAAGLRWVVIAQLVLERGSTDFDDVLAAHAVMENQRGIDTAPFEDFGWSASSILASRRGQRALEKHAATIVPHGGADNPVFASPLEEDEVAVMYLEYPGPISPDQSETLQAALQRGDQEVAPLGEELGCEFFDNPSCVALAFQNARRPAAVLTGYLKHLRDPALGVRGIALGRLRLPEDEGGLLHPSQLPDVEYDLESEDWFASSFDPSATPAPPEPESGFFMIKPTSQGHIAEQRLTPVRFEDVRVVYGLADVEDEETDERAEALTAALTRHLETAFAGCPPQLYNQNDQAGGVVDRISAQGRTGYAFALPQLTTEMLVHYPGSFRFREHELFEGIRAAVLELGLAPVIHYGRDNGIYIVNLWDR